MKRLLMTVLICVLLSGCGAEASDSQLESVRRALLRGDFCFTAHITSHYDYGEYAFSLHCKTDTDGVMLFEVVTPSSIEGICGSVAPSGGRLTFDDTVLGFPLQTQAGISPVCAPWIFCEAMRTGHLISTAKQETGNVLSFETVLEEETFRVDVVVSGAAVPEACEIYWENACILTLQITDVQFG